MNDRLSRPIGVLVAALGTPDAPTPAALRSYLKEFLSDRRVVDTNPLLWQLILRLIVLPRRPARSAALYRRIWTPEGSPLLVYSQRQAVGLQARLGDGFRVVLGMRYGQPSIAAAVAQLEAEGIDRILVLPMFPQFSSSTTASIYDAVVRAAGGRRCPLFFERKRALPTLRFVPPYYDHPGYLAGLQSGVERVMRAMPRPPERFLFSFHGVPQRFVDGGDPYRAQAETTARLLADALGLKPDQWLLTFQSRFGREPWLIPYTDQTLIELARAGVKSVLVACPGFTADCLETLDELGHEAARAFYAAGGESFQLVPCLNDQPDWLDAMADLVYQEASGWHQSSGRPSLTLKCEAALARLTEQVN